MDKQDQNLDEILYQQIFDVIPVGLVLLEQKGLIRGWNGWMVKNTGIEASTAQGKTLESLYPNQISLRVSWALEQVLEYGNPQVISSILNKYIIPIPLDRKPYLDLQMMQQDVEILPVHIRNQRLALLVIQDVSAKTHLNAMLMSMANKFEKSSFIDTLTGLYNRRFLWKHLESELNAAKREKFNVICTLFDLDHFKQINDCYGHQAGDEVLISFAESAQAQLRSNDYLFRYGGEEFIIISTRISLPEAAVLPNRIRISLQNKSNHGTVQDKVTCSGGVAYWHPWLPTVTAEQLINNADIQLYNAKKWGRNCIVMDNSIQ